MKPTGTILAALRRLDAEHQATAERFGSTVAALEAAAQARAAALFGPILCSLPGATALAASWRAIAEQAIPTTLVMTTRPTIDDLSRPSVN